MYSYDPSGKLIGSYEYLENEKLTRHQAYYAYDDLSRLTHVYQTVNYKVGSVGTHEEEIVERYVYDGRGRLTGAYSTLGDFDVGTVLQYDDFDRITSKGYVISVEPSEDYLVSGYYTYAALTGRGTTAQVETYTSTVEDPDWNIIDETVYRFTYDENGNITEIRNGSNAIIAQYTYDALGQLMQEINTSFNRRYVWTYDDAGNILSKKIYNKSSGALIETKNYTYSTGSWGDLLTGVGSTTIQYDSIGNPKMWGQKDGSIWYDGAILEWQGRQLHKDFLLNILL